MKKRINIAIILVFLLWTNVHSQVLTGEVNVQWDIPGDVFGQIDNLYPGEIVDLTISGEVNINPETGTNRECSEFLWFKLKCWDVPYVVNHWVHPGRYPAEVHFTYIYNGKVPSGMNNGYEIATGSSIQIEMSDPSEFTNQVKLKAYIPSKTNELGAMNRPICRGTYTLKARIDSRQRLNLLQQYFQYLKNNDIITYENVRKGVNKNLVRLFPNEVANHIVTFVNSIAGNAVPANSNEIKRILKFASTELAPNNISIKNKLGEFYLADGQFTDAEVQLKEAINKIKQTASNGYKDYEILGESYALLAKVYENREMGIQQADLTAASIYYEKSIDNYYKAVNFSKVSEVLLDQIIVLKKINTISSLKQARMLLKQAEPLYRSLYPYQSENKFGYIDKSGNIIIPAKYEEAYTFDPETKLATVKMNGKWGVISKNDKVIINFEYNNPLIMSAALYAPFLQNGKIGFIDRAGFVVTSPIFEPQADNNNPSALYDITGHFKRVMKDEKLVLYTPISGKYIEFPNPPPQQNGMMGFAPQNILIYSPDKRIVMVGNKFGLVDKSGNYILASNYDQLSPYKSQISSGFSSVVFSPQVEPRINGIPISYYKGSFEEVPLIYLKGREYGILDGNGEKFYSKSLPGDFPTNYISGFFSGFSFGLKHIDIDNNEFIIQKNEHLRQGAKNYLYEIKNGQEIILIGPLNIQYPVNVLQDGTTYVQNNANSFSIYSDYGRNKLKDLQCSTLFYNDPVFIASRNNKFAIISKNGEQITDFEFDQLSSNKLYSFNHGFYQLPKYLEESELTFLYKRGTEKGIIKANGEITLSLNSPEEFIMSMGKAYIVVSDMGNKNKRVLDDQGNEIIKLDSTENISLLTNTPTLKYASIFKMTGQAPNMSGENRIYDLESKSYTDIDKVIGPFYKSGDKYGFIEQYDQNTNASIYDSIAGFPAQMNDTPYYLVMKNGKKGLLDKELNTVLEIKYDEVFPVIPVFPIWELTKIDFTQLNPNDYFLMMPDAIKKYIVGLTDQNYTDLCFVINEGKKEYVNLKNEVVWRE